jgi:hypothetical protein
MTSKVDDLEAVRVLAETLHPFTSDDRERIIRWAREKLGMTVPVAGIGNMAHRVFEWVSFTVSELRKHAREDLQPEVLFIA